MTDRVDAEEVERLAKTADMASKIMKAFQRETQKHHEDVRDTLRALLDEREALEKEVKRLTLEALAAHCKACDDRAIAKQTIANVQKVRDYEHKRAEAALAEVKRLREAPITTITVGSRENITGTFTFNDPQEAWKFSLALRRERLEHAIMHCEYTVSSAESALAIVLTEQEKPDD